MTIATDIIISLRYVDDGCGSWDLEDLCMNRGVLAPEHMDAGGFGEALGGLHMYVDRIYRFVDTDGRTDLFSCAWFLLESVCMVRGVASDGRDEGRAVLHHEDGSVLSLEDGGEVVRLGFAAPEGLAARGRVDPYFDGVTIDARAWDTAAAVALDEYAMMVRRTAGPSPEGGAGPGRLLARWAHLSRGVG